MQLKYTELDRLKILKLAQKELWSEAGRPALDFLRIKRNLADDVIKQFQFGYCPRKADHDLRGRIIMPIFDAYGDLKALTTRNFDNPNNSLPHWHESFDKSLYVYGLNFAKEHIRDCDKVLVVEGQFDVSCLHSYGLPIAVGMLGTTLSFHQIIMMVRYCSEIYLMFDPDSAGRSSLLRAIKLYESNSLEDFRPRISLIPLEIDKDPDDFVVENGAAGIIKLMKKQKSLLEDRGQQHLFNQIKLKY